jgi:hypothetical protein
MTITILAGLIIAAAVLAVLWLPDTLLRPVLARLDDDYAYRTGPTRMCWQHCAIAPVVTLGVAIISVAFLAFAICAWLAGRSRVVLRNAHHLTPLHAGLAARTGSPVAHDEDFRASLGIDPLTRHDVGEHLQVAAMQTDPARVPQASLDR